MLFNSLSFAYFLPIVFIIYWVLEKQSLKYQNIALLIASYYFYSCWDYRFLFLLIFSTLLDYFTGIKMSESQTKGARKFWFCLSVCINLGFLGIFKYYDFFALSFADALSNLRRRPGRIVRFDSRLRHLLLLHDRGFGPWRQC